MPHPDMLQRTPYKGYNEVVPRPSPLPRLRDLAQDQWGLVTRRQIEAAGIGPTTLERLTAPGGTLERVARGVYLMVGAPSPDHQDLRAAWLQLAPDIPAWERQSGESATTLAPLLTAWRHMQPASDSDGEMASLSCAGSSGLWATPRRRGGSTRPVSTSLVLPSINRMARRRTARRDRRRPLRHTRRLSARPYPALASGVRGRPLDPSATPAAGGIRPASSAPLP